MTQVDKAYFANYLVIISGRYWDLECLLDGSRGIRPEDRQIIYLWTLQAYADAGMFDRAVALSGQLHLEGLGVNFPAYHQLMSSKNICYENPPDWIQVFLL